MFRPLQIKRYLKLMGKRGFNAAAILHGAQIDAAQLDDPAYLIEIWQSQKVVSNMIELTGNQALGFEMGREFEFDDFGIVGYALMSSRNIRDIINLWMTFSHALVGVMLKIRLEEKDSTWRVSLAEIQPMGSLLRFCVEESLTIGQWIGVHVMGCPLQIASVELSFSEPEPAHRRLYETTFNSPIVFNARESALNVNYPPLEMSGRDRRDSELFALCQRHCQQVLGSISAKRPLAFRLRQIFLQSPDQIPGLDEIATMQNCSARTLKRRLEAEGVSYKKLVNEFRADLAREYLASTHFSNKEIAFLLGYSEVKSFLRAFQSWTGTSMTAFREQQQDAAQARLAGGGAGSSATATPGPPAGRDTD